MWFRILSGLLIGLPIWIRASTAMSISCYYASWAVYRPNEGKCDIEDIDPFICTHLIYSFAGLNDNGTIRLDDPELDVGKRALYRFNELKKRNPKLKTLVAIGGWNEPPARFSKVASSADLRAAFVRSSLDFLKTYGFDGVDIDWEYPTTRGGTPEDKDNFSKLLQELRSQFDKYGFILTAAIVASPYQINESYDITTISKSLHSIHLMTYDIHSAYDNVTGENSPLYASPGDVDKTQNVDASVQYLLKNGAPPDKIIMGIPSYGITYTLRGESVEIGAPASGPGLPGLFTQAAGSLAYYEICSKLKAKSWKRSWSNEQKVPYAYGDNQWAGYDDYVSVKYKMKYATQYHLGGVMVWTIDMDDFRGICSKKYPLLTAMNKYGNNNNKRRKGKKKRKDKRRHKLRNNRLK